MSPPAPEGQSRRAVLRLPLLGGAALLLPPFAVRAAQPEREPHHFLLVVLNGGADPAYMFDARPLSMTKAGLIQNYLGEEPRPWTGRNGATTLATSLIQPLMPFRDRFSVLNGVYMAQGFDGHLQNMNFLFTGNPFGGESFVPHLNAANTGRGSDSLDAVSPTSPLPITVDNHSSVVAIQPRSAEALAAKLRQIEASGSGDTLSAFIRSRVMANAEGPGRFAAGARSMAAGLDGAPEIHRKLARLTSAKPGRSDERQAIDLVAECFRLSIARSAIYVPPEFFDVHAADLAKGQPKLFRSALARVAALLKGLVETPYDAKRSMMDVTTVMVATEFGRTMRTGDTPLDRTGTNHNAFSNTFLLGGKGIRPGLVLGASDLVNETEKPSPAHAALDPALEKTMGLRFDHAAMTVVREAETEFRIEQHLTVSSVINTVYAMFGVPVARHRSPGRNLPPAPVLRGLLA